MPSSLSLSCRATASAGSQSAQKQQARRQVRPEPLLIERKVSVSPFLATRNTRQASMLRRYSDAIVSSVDANHEDEDDDEKQTQGKPEWQLRTKNNKRLAAEDASDLYANNAAPSLVLLRKKRPEYCDSRRWLYWSAETFTSFLHTLHDLERHALSTGRGKVRVFFVAPSRDEEIELLPMEGDYVELTPINDLKGTQQSPQRVRVVEANGDAPSGTHARRARFLVLEGFVASTPAPPPAFASATADASSDNSNSIAPDPTKSTDAAATAAAATPNAKAI